MAAAFLTSLKVLPGDQQNVKRGMSKRRDQTNKELDTSDHYVSWEQRFS